MTFSSMYPGIGTPKDPIRIPAIDLHLLRVELAEAEAQLDRLPVPEREEFRKRIRASLFARGFYDGTHVKAV